MHFFSFLHGLILSLYEYASNTCTQTVPSGDVLSLPETRKVCKSKKQSTGMGSCWHVESSLFQAANKNTAFSCAC